MIATVNDRHSATLLSKLQPHGPVAHTSMSLKSVAKGRRGRFV